MELYNLLYVHIQQRSIHFKCISIVGAEAFVILMHNKQARDVRDPELVYTLILTLNRMIHYKHSRQNNTKTLRILN